MKSERRRDLAENFLAKWLGTRLEKTASFQSVIYWFLIAVLLAMCIWMLWSWYSRLTLSKSWTAYTSALTTQDEQQFDSLISDLPRGLIGARARTSAGEMLLAKACDLIFTDREQARVKLEKALGYFLSAQSMTSSSKDELAEQLVYDLGQAYEMLSYLRTDQGDAENAIRHYQKNVELWPKGVYYQGANRKLEQLNSPGGQRFVDYFTTLRDVPAFLSPVDLQINPSLPSIPSDLSLESQLDLDDNPVFPVE